MDCRRGTFVGVAILCVLLSMRFSEVNGSTTYNAFSGTWPQPSCDNRTQYRASLLACARMSLSMGFSIFSGDRIVNRVIPLLKRTNIHFIRSFFSGITPTESNFNTLCSNFHKIYQCFINVTTSCSSDATFLAEVNALITRYINAIPFYKSCDVRTGSVENSFKNFLKKKDNDKMVKCLKSLNERARIEMLAVMISFKKNEYNYVSGFTSATIDSQKALTACQQINSLMTIVKLASGCDKKTCKEKYLQMFRKYVKRVLAIKGKDNCGGTEDQIETFVRKGKKNDLKRRTLLCGGLGHIYSKAIRKFQTALIRNTQTLLGSDNFVITGNFTEMASRVDSSKQVTFASAMVITLYGNHKDCGKKKKKKKKNDKGKGKGKGNDKEDEKSSGQEPVETIIVKYGEKVQTRTVRCDKNKKIFIRSGRRKNSDVIKITDQCSNIFILFRTENTPTIKPIYTTVRTSDSVEDYGLLVTGSEETVDIGTNLGRRRKRDVTSSILTSLGAYDAASTGVSSLKAAMEEVATDEKEAKEADAEALGLATKHETTFGIVVLMAILSLLARMG